MIRDRGNKKWTSIFIPEHVEMLREMNRDYYREYKPVLDEFHMTEMAELVSRAREHRLPVDLTVWVAETADGRGHRSTLKGYVFATDALTKTVRIRTALGEIEYVKFADVLAVKVDD